MRAPRHLFYQHVVAPWPPAVARQHRDLASGRALGTGWAGSGAAGWEGAKPTRRAWIFHQSAHSLRIAFHSPRRPSKRAEELPQQHSKTAYPPAIKLSLKAISRQSRSDAGQNGCRGGEKRHERLAGRRSELSGPVLQLLTKTNAADFQETQRYTSLPRMFPSRSLAGNQLLHFLTAQSCIHWPLPVVSASHQLCT